MGHRSGLYTGVSQYVEGSKAQALVVALRLAKEALRSPGAPLWLRLFPPGLAGGCCPPKPFRSREGRPMTAATNNYNYKK